MVESLARGHGRVVYKLQGVVSVSEEVAECSRGCKDEDERGGMKKKKKSRARGPRIVSLCASVAQPRVIALSVLPSFPPSLPSVYKNRAPSGPRRHVDFCMQSFKTRGRGGGEPPVEVH